jgi:DNA-binding PadR family transcriptional regulator
VAVLVIRSKVAGATLTLVREQPGHGMDVYRRFQARYGTMLRPQPSHIYTALRGLENAGYVERIDRADNKEPEKSVYRITPQGVPAWQEWVGAPFLGDVTEVLIRVASTEDPEQIRYLLDEYETLVLREVRRLPMRSRHLGEQMAIHQASALADAHIEFLRLSRRELLDRCRVASG